jgi:hypothetical protein
METSIFTNKEEKPDDQKLQLALGDMYESWMEIRSFIFSVYPKAIEEWNYPGQKYGWSFRMKDKNRAIIYLLPRDRFFMAAFVFGGKATSAALGSDINQEIKHEIETAKVYAEGRGFRIGLINETAINDIKKLVNIKLSY